MPENIRSEALWGVTKKLKADYPAEERIALDRDKPRPSWPRSVDLLIPHLEVTLPAEVERNFLKNGTPN